MVALGLHSATTPCGKIKLYYISSLGTMNLLIIISDHISSLGTMKSVNPGMFAVYYNGEGDDSVKDLKNVFRLTIYLVIRNKQSV